MASSVPPARRRLCRLCLNDKDVLYPIFSGNIADLDEKIYDCTAVVIEDIDSIPAYICMPCRSKVIICQQFVLKCQKSDRKFHRLYGPHFRQQKGYSIVRENRLLSSTPNANPEPMTLDKTRRTEKAPVKTMIDGTVINPVVHRLKNDDKTRRHSIDSTRNTPVKKAPERRLSDEPTIEQLAARIEQSLKSENDNPPSTSESVRKKCPTCGQMVLNLPKHMDLHSTIRKHVCLICDRRFKEAYYLRYHMNSHTGEKPFKCQLCDQSFGSPAVLSNHKKNRHTNNSGEGPFHCNVCRCAFKHRKLMNKHMRRVHRERKHSCDTCGKAYYTREYLKKHRKLLHGVDEYAN